MTICCNNSATLPRGTVIDTFVIKAGYSGLGDHLFYSHLPRIAKESGRYNKVLVSSQSDFRNADYRRLIWESNPYVDGFTEEDAPTVVIGTVPKGMNILDQVMVCRGLEDGKRFHDPEIYYKPKHRPDLAHATVYDPNFVSYVGKVVADDADRYFRMAGIVPDFMLKLREKYVPATKFGAVLETSSFEDYCSIIVSAQRFICLTSGGATLAAAFGVPALALWGSGQNPIFHHSRLHTYANIHASFSDRYLPRMARSSADAYRNLKSVARRLLPR